MMMVYRVLVLPLADVSDDQDPESLSWKKQDKRSLGRRLLIVNDVNWFVMMKTHGDWSRL